MMNLRLPLASILLLLALVALPESTRAQIDTTDLLFTDDSLSTDTLIFTPSTLQVDTSLTIDTSFSGFEPVLPAPAGRSGLWLGPTVEFSTLDPHTLDPQLGGSLVMIGAQGVLLWDGYMIGGAGASGRVYNLPENYDAFSFGYGGILLGYDWAPGKQRVFTVRPATMLGFGGLSMTKKRPDFIDSAGHEIIERYRAEDFFLFRPGVSIGVQPIDWLEVRATADYLLPIGGANVGDLRKLTFGIQIQVGINFQ